MNELEPTLTYSNPTATDVLRRLLDERGVEYETDDTQVSDTEWYYVTKLRDGCHDRWIYEEPPDCDLLVSYQYDLGAEDAIAATLGSCNCSSNCTNSERTETCEADETDTWECVCDGMGNYGKRLTVHVMECTECGHTYEHVNGDYEYCPRCGRKREDVSE